MRAQEFILESANLLNKLELDVSKDGYQVTIPVDRALRTETGSIDITSITMWLAFDPAHGSGDLGIHFDGDDDEDDLYGDRVFEDSVREFLAEFGFPVQVAQEVGFSEGGMQDVGRASFDAYELEEYLRSLVLDSIGDNDPNQLIMLIKQAPSILLYVTGFSPQVANAAKTEIIKWCLGQFKTGQAKSAMEVVNKLKASGVDWPEFAAMEKSAGVLQQPKAQN